MNVSDKLPTYFSFGFFLCQKQPNGMTFFPWLLPPNYYQSVFSGCKKFTTLFRWQIFMFKMSPRLIISKCFPLLMSTSTAIQSFSVPQSLTRVVVVVEPIRADFRRVHLDPVASHVKNGASILGPCEVDETRVELCGSSHKMWFKHNTAHH